MGNCKKICTYILIGILVILLCSCSYSEIREDEQQERVSEKTEKVDEEKTTAQEETTRDYSYLNDYYKLINKYQKKYGKVKLLKSSGYLLYGLCCAKLVDFDGDGTDELVLAYGKKKKEYDYYNVDYSYEVWTSNNGKIIKAGKGTPIGYDGNTKEVWICSFNGKKYILSGGGDQFMTEVFYGLVNHKLQQDIMFSTNAEYDEDGNYVEDLFKINDKKVGESEFMQELYSRKMHCEKVNLHDSYDNQRGIKKCKKIITETKKQCLSTPAETQKHEVEKEDFAVDTYLNKWDEIVSKLNMSSAENKNVIEDSKAFAKNGLYVEYKKKEGYVRNEEENGISLYGIMVGENIQNAVNILNDRGWKIFYDYENVHNYVKIDGKTECFISIETNNHGQILYWEIYNNSSSWELTTYFRNMRIDMMSGWRKLYYDYLDKLPDTHGVTEFTKVSFIYVDKDEIPEMIINYGSIADGGEFCYVSADGILKSEIIGDYSFNYKAKQSIYCLSGGRMDSYYDRVYSYKNGKVELIGDGSYGAEDNSDLQLDENGNPIYVYYWNNKKVSAKKYQSELDKIYNRSNSKSPYDDSFTLWDVMEQLLYWDD